MDRVSREAEASFVPAPPAPVRHPRAAAPEPIRRSPRMQQEPSEKKRAEEKAAPRFPRWLSWALVISFFFCLSCVTAQALMSAYLTRQEQQRQEAHAALVAAHPLSYRASIEKYAAEYNLQPSFVAAIILNESSYRTGAESGVGARGLMQLMPATAEWIAGKLGVKNYSFDMLWDGDTNIRFGCWYLHYLSELFRGDPVCVISAYHAGQGQVSSWLSDPSISPDGVTMQVANMVEGPTKVYAGRVTKAYGIYDALYYHTFNPVSVDPDADLQPVS